MSAPTSESTACPGCGAAVGHHPFCPQCGTALPKINEAGDAAAQGTPGAAAADVDPARVPAAAGTGQPEFRKRLFFERWRWIEWLFAIFIAYLVVMSMAVPRTETVGLILLIVGFVVYKVISYSINLSERQCQHCGSRARKNEARCNSCGERLAAG